MSIPTIGVVVFPGPNCDRDAEAAWTELGFGNVKMLWHQDTDLTGIDAIIVPGGFSYGDALRAGAVAAMSPVMDAVADFAADGGPVAGICNGFQILCEAGLLPGALTRNSGLTFVCKPTVLKVCTDDSPFLFEYEVGGNVIIPIAHGEGRYVCSPETLAELEENDLIAFRYAENPNGSLGDIAGIIGGPDRNVLGMMPHPERAVSEALGSTGGIPFFVSLAGAIQQTLNEVTVG